MHWTALLAYRRFPPNAQVIDDLACIACGYNLRGLRVSGKCPECGQPIGDSLFVLAKPTEVGQCLNGVAKSFLAFYVILLGCVAGATAWGPIVIAGVFAFGSAWRLMTLIELRRRGAISALPVISTRLRALIACTVLDLIACLSWLAASVAIAKLPAFQSSTGGLIFFVTFLFWMCSTLLTAAAAGWLGLAFSAMLGHGWMQLEFKVQLIAIGVSALAVLGLVIVSLRGGASPGILAAFAGFALFIMAVSTLMTIVAVIHLGNAAEQEHETWDEALDSERIAIMPTPPNSSRADHEPPESPEVPDISELPAIKLAPPNDPSSRTSG